MEINSTAHAMAESDIGSMSLLQVKVLAELSKRGTMRKADLARSVGHRATVVGRSLAALEKAAMIERAYAVSGRHLQAMIAITPAGHGALTGYADQIIKTLDGISFAPTD